MEGPRSPPRRGRGRGTPRGASRRKGTGTGRGDSGRGTTSSNSRGSSARGRMNSPPVQILRREAREGPSSTIVPTAIMDARPSALEAVYEEFGNLSLYPKPAYPDGTIAGQTGGNNNVSDEKQKEFFEHLEVLKGFVIQPDELSSSPFVIEPLTDDALLNKRKCERCKRGTFLYSRGVCNSAKTRHRHESEIQTTKARYLW
jgi:hypothetical protein